MKFEKQSTTIDDQLKLLEERGMYIKDRPLAKHWLETVGYYRLSAYWLPFEKPAPKEKTRSKCFVDGAAFDHVIDLYVFDRKLRLLVFEAIERVEVNVRSRWTYHMVQGHGPHAHLDHTLFRGASKQAKQLARLSHTVENSNELFVDHYKKKYTEPDLPPLWAATELMSLGELSKWFEATNDNAIKSKVGFDLGLPTNEIVEGTLHLLSYVRNICAHHGRLWNRKTVKRVPSIKRLKSDMIIIKDGAQNQSDNRLYNILVLLLHLMDHQSTDTTWRHRLRELLEARSDDDRSKMGFPSDWQKRAIWNFRKN